MNTYFSENKLVFTQGVQAIEVHLHGQTLWLTQLQMAQVFDTTPENVLMHLKNIFAEGELDATATAKDFLAVRQEGSRKVKRRLKHYKEPLKTPITCHNTPTPIIRGVFDEPESFCRIRTSSPASEDE